MSLSTTTKMTTVVVCVALFCALVGVSMGQHISCNSTATVRIRHGIGNYPVELSGVTGTPVTLICEVTVPLPEDVIETYVWEFNRQIEGVFTDEDRVFRPVTSADGGEYRCRAVVTVNKGVVCETRHSSTVTINTEPAFTSVTSTVPVRRFEGESLRLTCEAEGHPPPTYEWFRTDTPSTILSTEAEYTLQALNVSGSGIYTCRASNREGNITRSVSVTVTTPPPPMTTSESTEPDTTTASPTTQETTSDLTQETVSTPSPVTFYIGVAVIAVVAVLVTLLTVLLFTIGIIISLRTNVAPKFGDEELLRLESEVVEGVDVEEPVFEEMVQEKGVIPQPKTKKTRGKHRKF